MPLRTIFAEYNVQQFGKNGMQIRNRHPVQGGHRPGKRWRCLGRARTLRTSTGIQAVQDRGPDIFIGCSELGLIYAQKLHRLGIRTEISMTEYAKNDIAVEPIESTSDHIRKTGDIENVNMLIDESSLPEGYPSPLADNINSPDLNRNISRQSTVFPPMGIELVRFVIIILVELDQRGIAEAGDDLSPLFNQERHLPTLWLIHIILGDWTNGSGGWLGFGFYRMKSPGLWKRRGIDKLM
ncbi:hypothetical protein B2K_39485 [Paenibacillus mucilaginosus K02]|uniref:Uncharacterized protein n=1 Tax=Paenibacillus mucilaginosus K02 TaxID=997761 RepID=R9UPG0_9BACL|nr:hypothetical protein B2K_39485 [Paenibacillus mucilaginosus K02]